MNKVAVFFASITETQALSTRTKISRILDILVILSTMLCLTPYAVIKSSLESIASDK